MMNTKSTLPRFTVYHLMAEFARDSYFKAFPLTAYTLVATVACEALGQTFEICNNGVPGREVECWQQNPEVIEVFDAKFGRRSLSVGDVVSDELGDWYRCASCGWTKLDARWFEDRASQPVEHTAL